MTDDKNELTDEEIQALLSTASPTGRPVLDGIEYVDAETGRPIQRDGLPEVEDADEVADRMYADGSAYLDDDEDDVDVDVDLPRQGESFDAVREDGSLVLSADIEPDPEPEDDTEG